MSEVGQSEPAYKVLAAELRSHIAQGRYKGGVRLPPTESELSQEYGLSRQTVRRAFLELVTEARCIAYPAVGPSRPRTPVSICGNWVRSTT